MLLRLDHERIVGDELGATEYGGKGNLYACEGSDGRDKRGKRRLMGAMLIRGSLAEGRADRRVAVPLSTRRDV